jgi:hypothetical protein
MRRIDVIGVGVGIFVAGGLVYLALQQFGIDTISAGIWTQLLLVGGLVGWTLTYVFRAVTGTMTYNQQLQEYEDAVLQKRLEDLTPEELAQLQARIEASEAADHSDELD